jgi:branched-chain amino acid transport system substrate-binding protein
MKSLYRLLPLCGLLFLLAGRLRAEDIVLGMSAPFSGSSAELGIELYRGSMAYFTQVNEAGGIHGRNVVLKAYDDRYDPDRAIDNTITLVERDNVLALFDDVGTPTVTRILPLLLRYSKQSVLLFFPYTGAQPHREPPYSAFVFNLRASYRQETEGLVDHFVQLGRKRVAIFYQADAYGRSGWAGVRSALAAHGLPITAEATYRRGTTATQNFQEQVNILGEKAPDAIIIVGAYAAAAGFICEARDRGIAVPIANLSFVGSEAMLQLLQAAGRAREKDYTVNLINSQVVPSYENMTLPAVRQYREMITRYDPSPPSDVVTSGRQSPPYSFTSFEGFLNAKLLTEILRGVDEPLSRASLRAFVDEARDYDIGIDSVVSFGPDRHQGLDNVYYTTVRDGRFVPLTDWRRWQR